MMNAFLNDIAAFVDKNFSRPEDVTIVFPNRRAGLHFRKYLASMLRKPVFSPRILTIEDFFQRFSDLRVPDKLALVFTLYQVYDHALRNDGDREILGGFEHFYFWGEMLLRDFDEVDKYLVNAEHLFKDLSHLKELDSGFEFLTEEQKEFLRSFWINFDENQSRNKRKFIQLWRRLPEIYKSYRALLAERGMAYEGMLHRLVAEQAVATSIDVSRAPSTIFAGFNALTACEERLISAFVLNGARVFWDVDAYYVNNLTQEAGKYFRQYQEHPILGKTFPEHVPAHSLFSQRQKDIQPRVRLFGAAQPVGQAKLMAQVLSEELAVGLNPEETVVVLPDEKLLFPVMHGVAGSVDAMNVTMGFPLTATPMFNFVELLIDLQISLRDGHFNHRQVLALLGHPYVVAADPSVSNAKRKEILRYNWVHIPREFVGANTEVHRLIFKDAGSSQHEGVMLQLITYLSAIVREVGALQSLQPLDKEYVFYFATFLNRLHEVLKEAPRPREGSESSGGRDRRVTDIKLFLRLFRQLIQSQKIPFSGEPLKGLQLMGVLETRNLDFKNVFVLSLNEGAFPGKRQTGSYIPFSIRKAYQLPTAENQDAMYAYLFYRLLQRADKAYLFYNSETDVLGQGEMSRFLQQLVYESGVPIEKKILHNRLSPRTIVPIVVEKSESVMDALLKAGEGSTHFKGFSPSALNTYLECTLKFYLRHVAKIREADEVEEDLDARVLGNFLHDVMERFYKDLVARKQSNVIEKSDFDGFEAHIDGLIDEIFIQAYRLNPNRKVEYHGQRLIVREIVSRFAHRIIEVDRSYTPFLIEGLEQSGLTFSVKISRAPHRVHIGGKIDRVDRKDDTVRIIDYKTGKDKLSFESVKSLFSRDARRNKAAFQTFLYALLYEKNFAEKLRGSRVVPGLLNRMNLFDDNFSFGLRMGKEIVTDAAQLLPEFEENLQLLAEEIYNPEVPFSQTDDREPCKLCPYARICYR